MSDFHNLQEENRRLAAEVERLKAELATANMPKLTPNSLAGTVNYLPEGQQAAQYGHPNIAPVLPEPE